MRELQEEIGIEVPVPTSFPFTRIQDETLDLAVYVVKSWAGQAKNLSPEEHDRVEWFAADDLAGLRLAHPSYLVLLSAVLRDAPDPGHEVER